MIHFSSRRFLRLGRQACWTTPVSGPLRRCSGMSQGLRLFRPRNLRYRLGRRGGAPHLTRIGRNNMKAALKLITLALLTAAMAAPVRAQDYPTKPIRIISDSAPGRAVDVTFRMVMDRVGTLLGQQIVAVDQPGASGAVAAHPAAHAVPDGY